MRLISELKRRNVVRMTLAYLAMSWLVVQVADIVLPTFGLPARTISSASGRAAIPEAPCR